MSGSDAEDSGLHPLPTTVDVITTEHAPLALDSDDLPLHAHVHTPRASTKRKRVVLSIHDKQQVLQRLEGGEQPMAIARTFGISRQQVSDIKKNKERIVAFCLDAKHMSTLKRKTLKATSEYHPGVEQELYRWIIRQRRLGRDVTAESLTTKTSDLFVQYSADDSHMSFKAITTWLRHFKKAHGLKALTEEELVQLPQQFVPAMEMTRPTATETGISGAVTPPPANYLINSAASHALNHLTAGAGNSISAMAPTSAATTMTGALDNPFVDGSVLHGGGRTTSLQATVNTVQQLNAQLARFERDMAIKLDYLDERVTKLCFLALPS
ncbi:hypothetical protein PF005_g924 [Phytophthora fragariae]|uniref:HTH CENPB-type domain-containing protein n=1 Tax=Phytophthora fragariae TaxID=53985 RepID=A0A6A4AME9_9STRA|nr:hypothetical protein PF003_g21127 [Phytophthora fragariae]KAE8949773.1 hypothetical protein PF009_g675 [Phytophthora fragariae]KAE9026474.1 hypothetical protein PF011_g2520 [Phytophthora fragariae]KAE9139050.1 hypothetical protein PF010_g724 [Phytophthora fragariae]KAE9140420.1 hypothetical protein PF007_g657 [Phytophthora fragariae]